MAALITEYWCPECEKRQPIDAEYAVSGSQVCCMICGYKWPVDFDFTWDCPCGAQEHIVEYGEDKERILRCNVCGTSAPWPGTGRLSYSTRPKVLQAPAQILSTEQWRCSCGATEVSVDLDIAGHRMVRCSDVCGKPLPYQALNVPREYPEKLVSVGVTFARCVYCFEEAITVETDGKRVLIACQSCKRATGLAIPT